MCTDFDPVFPTLDDKSLAYFEQYFLLIDKSLISLEGVSRFTLVKVKGSKMIFGNLDLRKVSNCSHWIYNYPNEIQAGRKKKDFFFLQSPPPFFFHHVKRYRDSMHHYRTNKTS